MKQILTRPTLCSAVNVSCDAAHDRSQDLMQPQTRNHSATCTVGDVEKLRVKITDKLREEKIDRNLHSLVKRLTVVTQQVKPVRIQSHQR